MKCPNCDSDQHPHRCLRDYTKTATGIGVDDGKYGDDYRNFRMVFGSFLVSTLRKKR